MLPFETDSTSSQNTGSTNQAEDIDTLNIMHSDNTDEDIGELFYRTEILYRDPVTDLESIQSIENGGLALTGSRWVTTSELIWARMTTPSTFTTVPELILTASKPPKSCLARAMKR